MRQLHDETGLLREQIDASSGSHDELQSARDEVKALKRALEAATAERDRDVAGIQTNLATASKDLDKWRQTANKYEREIDSLQRDLQQQSKQWQKTAEIQGNTRKHNRPLTHGVNTHDDTKLFQALRDFKCTLVRPSAQKIVLL